MSTASPLARTAAIASNDKSHTIDDGYGYSTNVFPGKEEQMVKVCDHLEKTGFIPKELVKNEVSWFYGYV